MKEFEKLLNTDKLLLIDFVASWCGPCQMMEPVMEELKKNFKDEKGVEIVKLDINENPELSEKYSVMSVPTFVFIKNGEVVDLATGPLPKDLLAEKIKSHLG